MIFSKAMILKLILGAAVGRKGQKLASLAIRPACGTVALGKGQVGSNRFGSTRQSLRKRRARAGGRGAVVIPDDENSSMAPACPVAVLKDGYAMRTLPATGQEPAASLRLSMAPGLRPGALRAMLNAFGLPAAILEQSFALLATATATATDEACAPRSARAGRCRFHLLSGRGAGLARAARQRHRHARRPGLSACLADDARSTRASLYKRLARTVACQARRGGRQP